MRLLLLALTLQVHCLAQIPANMRGNCNPASNWVTTPTPLQVFQRSGSIGSIYIAGYVQGDFSVEASFNGGTFQTVATRPKGYFSATLTNQSPGWGVLTVRHVESTNTFTQITCGVGDVFVIAGQSNASGRGSNNQSYSSSGSSLQACEFSNAYSWADLLDPSDIATALGVSSQSDAVSADIGGTAAAGSVWPLIATYVLTNNMMPVAFIPCAKGGSSITEWQPGASHYDRGNLYGSMSYRAKYAILGGVKAVLWWQGETDALASMSQASYFAYFTNLSASVRSDLGVKTMPCKLQNCSGLTGPQQDAINAAIGQAWVEDPNADVGPNLTGLNTAPEDTFHLTTNSKLASAASLWWVAIKTAFSW